MADRSDSRSLLARLAGRSLGEASSRVSRGMATLAVGSGLGRLISIAAIPAITRLYSPMDFGVLAVFTALVTILAPLVTLRYALALPLPRHDGVAINLFALSAGLMVGLSALIAGVLWCEGEALLGLISMESLAPWWWLIVLGVLGAACYELLTLWATRRRAYKVIAQTNVIQSIAGAGTKIILGLLGLKQFGLLVGQVVSQTGGVGTLLRGFGDELLRNSHHIRWSRIRKVASRHRAFPIYRVPSQFLMVFSMQAPTLFVAALYDPKTTGYLGLALMAISLPVSVLGQTTARAFYAEASSLGSQKPEMIRALLNGILLRLGLLSLVPATGLFFFGEKIFLVVFGNEWGMAGRFASALSVYLFFQFLQSPVAHVFYLFDGQRALLLLNAQRAVLTIVVFACASAFAWSSQQTIRVYSVVLAFHYALSTIYAHRFVPRTAQE